MNFAGRGGRHLSKSFEVAARVIQPRTLQGFRHPPSASASSSQDATLAVCLFQTGIYEVFADRVLGHKMVFCFQNCSHPPTEKVAF